MIEADRLISASERPSEEAQDRAIRPVRLREYTGAAKSQGADGDIYPGGPKAW